MVRRRILISAAAAVLGLLPTNLEAEPAALKDQLVGTWTAVSWEELRPDGTKRQLVDPKGFLIFDSSGRYAQVIARAERPKFKLGRAPTVDELVAAVDDFFAATGRGR